MARDQANAPIIIDHNDEAYDGLTYTYPKSFYCPLRSSGKVDKSEAQSVFGGKKPETIQLRNPKSYIKKHGNMSQKIPLRHTDIPDHERYLGTDCYADMY